jgi:hypothetical protein
VLLVRTAEEADVEHPLAPLVVEGDRLVALGRADDVPEVGQADDGELQALGPVDGQDLHREVVGLQPAGARLVAVPRPRVGHPPAQPRGQRRRAEALRRPRPVQELGDVAQVGERPLAAGAREHAGGQALGGGDRRRERRHPARAQQPRPPVQPRVDGFQLGRRGRRQARGVPAHEGRQRDEPGGALGPRALERLEQPQPVHGRLGGEDAAGAREDDGDPEPLEARMDPVGVLRLAAQDRDVAGPDPAPRPVARVELGGAGQQRHDLPGAVLGDERAARADLHRVEPAGALDRGVVAVDDAEPQRGRVGRAVQAPGGVVGADRAVGDQRVAELGAGQERVVGVDEVLVRAPVDVERPHDARVAQGAEVGVDVRPRKA